jgi:hypothetical protein
MDCCHLLGNRIFMQFSFLILKHFIFLMIQEAMKIRVLVLLASCFVEISAMDLIAPRSRNLTIGQDREYLMRAVDLILWFGCLVFFLFVVSIWLWLGSNMKRRETSDDEIQSLPKIYDEEDQRGTKSPTRGFVGTGRIQRAQTLNRIIGSP